MIVGLFFGSMLLSLFGFILKKKVDYKALEEGFSYLLVASVYLVFLDILHLFIPSTYFLGKCLHLSFLAQLILIPVWMSFLMERFLGLRKRYVLLPALFLPLSLKYYPEKVLGFWSLLGFSIMGTVFFYRKGMKNRAAFCLFFFFFLLIISVPSVWDFMKSKRIVG